MSAEMTAREAGFYFLNQKLEAENRIQAAEIRVQKDMIGKLLREVGEVERLRHAMSGLVRGAGEGHSDAEVVQQGYQFRDWEAGFNAACAVIETRVWAVLFPAPKEEA